MGTGSYPTTSDCVEVCRRSVIQTCSLRPGSEGLQMHTYTICSSKDPWTSQIKWGLHWETFLLPEKGFYYTRVPAVKLWIQWFLFLITVDFTTMKGFFCFFLILWCANPRYPVPLTLLFVSFSICPGYVQGMSDLLSPLLFITQNEVESFWCLTGFMELLVGRNASLSLSQDRSPVAFEFWPKSSLACVVPLFMFIRGDSRLPSCHTVNDKDYSSATKLIWKQKVRLKV